MTPRRLICLVLMLLGSVLVAPLSAEDAAKQSDIPFEKYLLANGLEVILHRDSSLPMVAVNLWYHVGPSNEPKGRSGFAHLFEHLMFEGSRHVGRRFDALMESAGATRVNGTTSWDRTNYFETVPREHLELALWIEGDRMGFMLDAITPERLEVQRGVVKNERRQSLENAPYGPSSLALTDAMFPDGHPYHGAIIGSMKDLDAAKMSDVEQFFRAYYAPSNATLVLAGDFDPAQAKAWIEKYFGTLEKRPKPAKPATRTPPLDRQIRVDVEEPVELAKVSLGWIAPPTYGPDHEALEVLAAVLAGGKASRLYRVLVVEQKVASEVEASLDPNALCSMFNVAAVAASGKKPSELEAAIDEVLAALQKEAPSTMELERAQKRLLVNLESDLQLLNGGDGESGRAGLLQRFNHYLGDPNYLGTHRTKLKKVTAEDVKRVASTHLPKDARVVVTTLPKTEEKK
jgi:zinc protease